MMKKILLVFITLSALAGGVWLQRHWASAAPAKDELAVAFPDLDGKPHRLDEWKGKVLIVNFWATWCPPCLEEMPGFVQLQNEYGSKGLQFVGILTDDEADAAREFLQAKPVNYPILDGSIGGRALTGQWGDTAGVLPISAVFDPQGRRVHTEIGTFTRQEVLEKIHEWIK